MWPPGLLVALMVVSSPARADPAKVALAISDPELGEALATALAPLGFEVVSVELDLASPRESEEHDTLRALAESQGAAAVVWLESLGSGFLLSAYSARSGETRSCPVADAPPYDDATAVAVAFSIKRLLREASVIAMPSIRGEGAEEETALEVEERPQLQPNDQGAADTASYDASSSEMTTEAVPPPVAVKRRPAVRPSLPMRSRIWIELGYDEALATDEVGGASQARVGLTYWSSTAADRLGVSLVLGRAATAKSEGGGVEVELGAFEASLGARLRLSFARYFALIPEVGVALRLTRLRGLPTDAGEAAAVRRTGCVSEGALALAGFVGPRFALALTVRLGVYFWPVQYTWEGEPILEEPWTRSSAGLRATFAF